MTAPLTSLSHGAGCGCKLSAADLRPIVASLPRPADPRVLVAADTADDAAVVQLTPDLAIVQTADFFTPIVDDPYAFGRIAATNALSDVYAMGGRPVSALNLVAYPLETLGPDVLREILRGGADAAAAAGAAVVGGHSIDDPEPKYGMAVVGVVAPGDVLTQRRRPAGDALVLTKPLGAGAVATAIKRGPGDRRARGARRHGHDDAQRPRRRAGARRRRPRADRRDRLRPARPPARAGRRQRARRRGRGRRRARHEGALELLEDDRCVAGGSRRNRADAETFTRWGDGVPEVRRRLLSDAMTSGGLLAAVPAERAGEIDGALIGRLVAGEPGTITVV